MCNAESKEESKEETKRQRDDDGIYDGDGNNGKSQSLLSQSLLPPLLGGVALIGCGDDGTSATFLKQ